MLQDFYSASDQLGTLCMKMLRKETAFSYRLIDLRYFCAYVSSTKRNLTKFSTIKIELLAFYCHCSIGHLRL